MFDLLLSARLDYSMVEDEFASEPKTTSYNTFTIKGREYKIPSGQYNQKLMQQLNRGGKKSSKTRRKNKEASKQRKNH